MLRHRARSTPAKASRRSTSRRASSRRGPRRGSATYRLGLAREADGATILRVTTSLPVTTGDRYGLVGADGRLVPLKSEEPPAPLDLTRPTFALDVCANAHSSSHRYGPVDYQVTLDPRCTAESLERIEPWSPRATTCSRSGRRSARCLRPTGSSRGFSLFTGLIPLLIAGGIVLMAVVPDHGVGYGVGIPLAALGAGLGAYKIHALLSPDTETVVYP